MANPRNPYHGRPPEVALRRWRSFGRRAGVKSATRDQRIEDLAKGLRDAFERDRHLVGRLMEDYRHLARTLPMSLKNTDGNAHRRLFRGD